MVNGCATWTSNSLCILDDSHAVSFEYSPMAIRNCSQVDVWNFMILFENFVLSYNILSSGPLTSFGFRGLGFGQLRGGGLASFLSVSGRGPLFSSRKTAQEALSEMPSLV
jgi:hypothetical protein